MNEVHRVFFHELGHFVAHEMNARFYGGHQTKSIVLQPYPPLPQLYIGEAKIEWADPEKIYIPSRKEVPIYLATSTYGCIFQANYTGQGLKEAQNLNGGDDLQQWYGALALHQLEDSNADIHSIDLAFMDQLRNHKVLEEFMALHPEDYLLSDDGILFTVDVQKLRNEVSGLCEKHLPVFDGLITQYINALAPEKQNEQL